MFKPFDKLLPSRSLLPAWVFAITLMMGLGVLALLDLGLGGVLPGLVQLKALMSSMGAPPTTLASVENIINQLQHQVWMMAVSMCMLVAMAAGLIAHWMGVAHQERRTRAVAEDLRVQAQAAQREAVAASQDKAKFLGMLSHELLTPLQTMLSTLGLIESRGGVDLSDPTFIRLKESSRILHSRMSDLIDFAKLSVGRLELRIRPFTPMRLLTMLVDDYAQALQDKGLDFHWEPTAELSQRVFSDPTRIRQIFENILSNAIKYTERGGITLQADLKDHVFRVEFADSGVGIAPQHLTQIFDPFYRVKESAHLAVGSGLGLAVVRSLIEMLHGRVELYSEPGQGLRFVVEIPVSSNPMSTLPSLPSSPTLSAVPTSPLKGSRPPVLVVDDDPGIRHSIADMVRAQGYDAVEVSNGRTALQELQARAFLAVFCDIQLPDISGIDVAEKVRQAAGPNVATYLVRMTAFHGPDARAASLFNRQLDKPLDAQQVSEVLRAAQAALAPPIAH